MVDYYSILGLANNATKDDVKKAYKKLAKKWHPDKNPDNQEEATRRFKEVSEAYQVLVDDSKRRTYDREGKEGLNPTGSKKNSYRDNNFNFPRPEDFSYPDTDNIRRHQEFSDLGARRSRFRNNRRNTEPNFGHSTFMFKDPDEVFKDFFGGTDPFKDFMARDPFKDFLDPFGSGGGGLGVSRFPNCHQSERSIPMMFGFSSSHGLNLPHTSAFHGLAGRKSIFDDLDEIDAMFGGLGIGGHTNRFHQQSGRPSPRSRSSHPTSHSRQKPQSSSQSASQNSGGHRRKRY